MNTLQSNSGLSLLQSSAEARSSWVDPGRHRSVIYLGKDKKKLAVVLKRPEVDILANSVFLGHGQLQHVDSNWNKEDNL